MNEKASRNDGGEGTDSSAKKPLDIPDIPLGEEFALDPVGDVEIDPLPKWWDEPIVAERGKVGNRRLEEGGEPDAPRRKKLRSLDETTDVPEAAEAQSTPAIKDPMEAIARAESEAPKKAGDAETPADSGDNTFFNMPEIDAGVIKVKRARKGEGSADDDDLSAFFGETIAAEVPSSTGAEEPDKSTTTPEKKAEVEPSLVVEAAATAPVDGTPPQPKGPPPIPVKFDGAFEEKKPLIAAGPPVKMRPPVPAEPEVKPAPPSLPVASVKEAAPVEEAAPAVAEVPPVPEVPEEVVPPVQSKPAAAPPPVPMAEAPVEPKAPEPDHSPETPVTVAAVTETPVEKVEAKPAVEPKAKAEEEIIPLESEESFAVIGDPLPIEERTAPVKAAAEPVVVKKKAGCWTVFATLFFFATMLVVVLLGGGAFYAWSKAGKFTGEFASMTQGKLEEKGIYLDYGTWSYAFPRGFVFDEVTVYEDATKSRTALKVSGLGVNVDLLGLAKDPGSLGAAEFSLRDSKVTLYQKGELFTEFNGVEGEILVDASAVSVERLAADAGGLRVRLDGVVKLPDKDAITPAAPGVAVAGETPSSPLSAVDFTAFSSFAPWFAFESTGGEPPVLAVSFAMDAREPDLATIEGHLGGTAVKWHGIEFTSLSAAFRIDPKSGELRFPNVQAGYGNGLIGAVLAVDMASQTLKIERFQSTADLPTMLAAYDASWGETFKLVRFEDAPTLQVSGEMPLAEPVNAKLEIRYEHLRGIVYRDGERELPLTDIRGKFTYDGGALETNDAAARLFGGVVFVNGATNLVREKRPFTGLVELTGVSLKDATSWFGQEGTGLSGRLFLTFRGTGNAEISSINGGGNLRIEEAELPSFPAVGKVQALLGGVVPAFGIQGGGTVSGAYILESGVLVTSDLTVRNGGVRIVTNGNLNLASQEASFVSTAELEPSLAVVTGLKDKAIQVEGTGPLREPVLKLRQFPVDFAAANFAQVLGTTPETIATLKSLVGSEKANEILTGNPGELPGMSFDPAVLGLINNLLGQPAQPSRQPLRAVPQN